MSILVRKNRFEAYYWAIESKLHFSRLIPKFPCHSEAYVEWWLLLGRLRTYWDRVFYLETVECLGEDTILPLNILI